MQENTSIEELVKKQRAFFETKATFSVSFRTEKLKQLKQAILDNEDAINEALQKDLKKSSFETFMVEIGMVVSDMSYIIKHMKKWAKKKYVSTPISQFPSTSFIMPEPFGVTLVMSPWNYPFMLCLEPMVGALAAGNTCILKPSAYSSTTSDVIAKIIAEVFEEEYVAVVKGGREENQTLLEQRFDYIFFTGGVKVGKYVMEMASKNLTPITLELGGKSPCIIDKTADLKVAADRIAFGKYLNSGQTCVAPDYLLIDSSVKKEFLTYFKKSVVKMYGEDAFANQDYPKMINLKHYNRVKGLIVGEEVVFGAKYKEETLQIAPTVLENITENSKIMQEEIFGPVLPVITVANMEEAEAFVRKYEKPLAFYLFSTDKKTIDRFVREVSFGGGCINDTIIHLASSKMGFGGVGASGMGSYHGKNSFDTFTHYKGVIKKSNKLDLPFRYQPYNKVKEKLIRIFLR